MSLDITAIQKSLHDWVSIELGLKTIFAHQDGPTPTVQYALINILQASEIGHCEADEGSRQVDLTIDMEYSGLYNIMVSINVFRDDALSKIIKLRDSVCKVSVKEDLWADGLAFINTSDVRDVPDVVDKSWEQRAQIDFFFHVRSLVTENIDEIKKIELTNKIDGTTTTIQ